MTLSAQRFAHKTTNQPSIRAQIDSAECGGAVAASAAEQAAKDMPNRCAGRPHLHFRGDMKALE
jgi:hypothetical protein